MINYEGAVQRRRRAAVIGGFVGLGALVVCAMVALVVIQKSRTEAKQPGGDRDARPRAPPRTRESAESSRAGNRGATVTRRDRRRKPKTRFTRCRRRARAPGGADRDVDVKRPVGRGAREEESGAARSRSTRAEHRERARRTNEHAPRGEGGRRNQRSARASAQAGAGAREEAADPDRQPDRRRLKYAAESIHDRRRSLDCSTRAGPGRSRRASRATAAPAAAMPRAKPTRRPARNETLQNGGDTRGRGRRASSRPSSRLASRCSTTATSSSTTVCSRRRPRVRRRAQALGSPRDPLQPRARSDERRQDARGLRELQTAIKYGDAPLQSKDKYDNAKNYLVALEPCDRRRRGHLQQDRREGRGRRQGSVHRARHLQGQGQGRSAPDRRDPRRPSDTRRGDRHPVRRAVQDQLHLYTVAELTRYRRKWDAAWTPYAVMGGGVAIGVIGGVFELSRATSTALRHADRAAATTARWA